MTSYKKERIAAFLSASIYQRLKVDKDIVMLLLKIHKRRPFRLIKLRAL